MIFTLVCQSTKVDQQLNGMMFVSWQPAVKTSVFYRSLVLSTCALVVNMVMLNSLKHHMERYTINSHCCKINCSIVTVSAKILKFKFIFLAQLYLIAAYLHTMSPVTRFKWGGFLEGECKTMTDTLAPVEHVNWLL